jgi:hypothetical protein
MSSYDLNKSMENALLRLSGRTTRRRRSDAGVSRLDVRVVQRLRRLLRGQERPPIRHLLAELQRFCKKRRLRTPSRATIYNFIPRCPSHAYSIAELPAYVREALYNLDPAGTVPGHQLAFYAFQYGDTRAASFAAGLPWLDLYQADRVRGWRSHSQGLLRAVLERRAIA